MSAAATGPAGAAGGEPLRRLRTRAGLSQQDLATRAGISVRTLRSLEQGTVGRPHAASVSRLAAALDVSVDELAELLGEVGDPGRARQAASAVAAAADGWVRIGILGPLIVSRDRAVHDIPSPILRTLLGLLSLQAGRTVGTEEIVDALWPDDPPRTCLQLIHTYIRQLRQVLEPGREVRAPSQLLRRVADGYRLDLGADQLDLAEFGQLAGRAAQAWSAGAAESAWQLYSEAWSCWRGPLLAGSEGRLRGHPAAAAAARARITMIVEWADAALGLGYCDRMVGPLRAVCAEEPLHEGLAARLMLALAGDGDQAAALGLFDAIRSRLDEQLGVTPGRELQAAQLRVLRGQLPVAMRPMAGSAATSQMSTDDRGTGGKSAHGSSHGSAGAPGPAVAAPPVRIVPAQLPTDVAGFTGRDAELRALGKLLAQPDAADAQPVIVTIGGMGGVGKSAMAVHWAHRVRKQFPDGQLYVNLRGYAEDGPLRPIDALAGFLHAFGVPANRVPADETQAAAMYRSQLAGKRVLVLLDNAASAQQVRPLLPAGSGSLAVVTSRERMAGLVARDGAHWSALDALPPRESIALLSRLLGAERVAGEPEPAAHLARLCAHLPLALRVAAANLTFRPSHRIADFVAKLTAGDRLAALEVDGDSSTAVRATFKLSCASLPAVERRVFRLLGLAPGPDATAEAVAALAGLTAAEAEHTLERLTSRHLVSEYLPGRYTLHDLLRLYGAELAAAEEEAAEREAAVLRFAAYFRAGVARSAQLLYPHLLHLPAPDAPVLPTSGSSASPHDSSAALAWLDAERATLVALIVHLADHGHHAAAWGLADLLNGYFMLRLNQVDWQVVAEAAGRASYAGGDAAVQAAAEIRLGMAYDVQCRYPEAAHHHRLAAELSRESGWTGAQAVALNNLSRHHWMDGDVGTAIDLITEALALNRAAGRREGEAVTLANLAVAHTELAAERKAGQDPDGYRQSLETARDLLTEALELHRRIGDTRNEAYTLRSLSQVCRDAGELPQALELAEQSLRLARAAEDSRFEISALNALATARVRLGQGEEGLGLHRRALRAAREIGDLRLQAFILLDLADAQVRLGHPDEAEVAVHDVLTVAGQINSRLLERQARRVIPDYAR